MIQKTSVEHLPDTASASRGKAVCLVSGGIDSPVAAWMMMRVGIRPVFIHFDPYPFGDSRAREIAMETIRRISPARPSTATKAYFVSHGRSLEQILDRCPRNLTCIISRRMMLRVAERIAGKEDANAIVLGDVLGQKASQTLTNLVVTDTAVANTPILRPLLATNKTEIEKVARQIGTFEISTRPGVCSCGVQARKPRTKARFDEIERAEMQIQIENLVSSATAEAEVVFLNA